jgi:hypothetical protein
MQNIKKQIRVLLHQRTLDQYGNTQQLQENIYENAGKTLKTCAVHPDTNTDSF